MTENLSQLNALVVITEPPLTDLTAPHKQASPPLRINRALRFGGDHVDIASARIQISSKVYLNNGFRRFKGKAEGIWR